VVATPLASHRAAASDPDLTARNLEAQALSAAGRYSDALDLGRRVLADAEQRLGPRHPTIALYANNVARLLEIVGRYAEAEPMFQRALAIGDAHLPPDDPLRIVLRNNLAEFYRARARYAEAEVQYGIALERALALAGPQSEFVAIIRNNTGELHRVLGRFEAAESDLRAALAIFEALRGPEHLDVATLHNNLGMLMDSRGRLDEAQALYERALAIRQKSLPPTHPVVALSLYNLSGVYLAAGRLRDAETAARSALEATEAALGPTHADVALMASRLAIVVTAAGRLADAESLHRRALTLMEAAVGVEHPSLANVLLPLSVIEGSTGRLDAAAATAARAVAITERHFGPASADLTLPLNNLADVHRRAGRFDVAELLYQRALTVAQTRFGPEHALILLVSNNLADVLSRQGHKEAALETFSRLLAVRERSPTAGLAELVLALNNVATTLSELGRHAEATPLFERAMTLEEGRGVAAGEALSMLYINAANNAEARGQIDDVARLRAKLAALPGWQAADVEVLYATNRTRTADAAGRPRFGDTPLIDPAALVIGAATVRAPRTEVLNRAARTAEAMGRIDRAGGRQTDELALAVHRVAVSTDDGQAAIAGAGQRLDRSVRFPGQMLLYVHGYNNSFDDALRRTAMIAYDLDFDGPIIAFAWPARSGLSAYLGDRERAQSAGPFLLRLLETLFTALPQARLHVIGHSTGAELVLGALERLADRRRGSRAPLPLGEVIFAHADVSPVRLGQALDALQSLGVRITSYSSREDIAMRASDWIRRDGARVGGAPVYLRGVDAIDISGLGARYSLNHAVFVRNPIVFGDMARLMASGSRPPTRRTPDLIEVRTAAGIHFEVRPATTPQARSAP
jgi:esterase/lipase superfamily enzyme